MHGYLVYIFLRFGTLYQENLATLVCNCFGSLNAKVPRCWNFICLGARTWLEALAFLPKSRHRLRGTRIIH
jgi:hypothetical protein